MNKFRVAGAGAPRKAVDLRKALFKYFVDVHTSLKGRLPTKVFLLRKLNFFTTVTVKI